MSKFIPVVAMMVTVVIATVNIWIAIKIKFAPDAATVVRDIKSILWKVLFWTSNAACFGVIIWLFVSEHPVDRVFIFLVMYNSFSLFNTYLMTVFINPLLKRESVTIDLIGKLSAIDNVIIERTGIGKIS